MADAIQQFLLPQTLRSKSALRSMSASGIFAHQFAPPRKLRDLCSTSIILRQTESGRGSPMSAWGKPRRSWHKLTNGNVRAHFSRWPLLRMRQSLLAGEGCIARDCGLAIASRIW